jgi:hypothetical protein
MLALGTRYVSILKAGVNPCRLNEVEEKRSMCKYRLSWSLSYSLKEIYLFIFFYFTPSLFQKVYAPVRVLTSSNVTNRTQRLLARQFFMDSQLHIKPVLFKPAQILRWVIGLS